MVLWNFTIDDASPSLNYVPFSDGNDLLDGWKTWYTRSGFGLTASDGDSFHVTSSPNSSVSLEFHGTGIELYGTSNAPFDVTIDNNIVPSLESSSSLLYSVSNLVEDVHYVTVSPKPSNSSQQFGLDYVTISTPLPEDENPLLPVIIDPNDGKLHHQGSWTPTNSSLQTTDQDASVSWNVTGARAVYFKGSMAPDSSLYSVALNGVTTKFNATSLRPIHDTVLFFQCGLNPAVNYTISITNLVGGKALELTSLAEFLQQPKNAANTPSDPGPATKTKLNPAVIYGPVLATIVASFVFAFLFNYFRQRLGKLRYIRNHMPEKLTLTFQPSAADTRGPPPPPRPSRPPFDILEVTAEEPASPTSPPISPASPISPARSPNRLPSYHTGDAPHNSSPKKFISKAPIVASPPRPVKPLLPPPPSPSPPSILSLLTSPPPTAAPSSIGTIRKLPIPPVYPNTISRLQGEHDPGQSSGNITPLPVYQKFPSSSQNL